MTKLSLSFIIGCCLGMNRLQAQERITTDRPDRTEVATLTPLHYFQGEFGFTIENLEGNNYNIIHPTGLMKYGVSKTFELRIEGDFSTEYRQLIPKPKKETGLNPLEIGFKAALIKEQKKLLPKTSVIVHAGIPVLATSNFKPVHIAPKIVFTMENDLTKSLGISYNLGTQWDGFTSTPAWLYSLSFGFDLAKNWEGYIEGYGGAIKNKAPENGVDGGIIYYISNDVKIDVNGGFGLSNAAPDNYIGVGISFRFR
jgi:hypothetical protein